MAPVYCCCKVCVRHIIVLLNSCKYNVVGRGPTFTDQLLTLIRKLPNVSKGIVFLLIALVPVTKGIF